MTDITHFLEQLADGDEHAAERLLDVVYAELRVLAKAKLAKEAPGHTLQPTALVHEAWMRLVGDEPGRFGVAGGPTGELASPAQRGLALAGASGGGFVFPIRGGASTG